MGSRAVVPLCGIRRQAPLSSANDGTAGPDTDTSTHVILGRADAGYTSGPISRTREGIWATEI